MDPPTPTSVSSSHDKLNGMKRLKQRVGYEAMNGWISVPNRTMHLSMPHLAHLVIPFSGAIKLAA